MFTGIVETRGTLERKIEVGGDCRLIIHTGALSLAGCSTGDSISVSGACLTMLDPEPNRFTADVSQETLTVTTLGQVEEGGHVNLELAMGLDDRMGGHLVTGHVDGKARLVSRARNAVSATVPRPTPMYSPLTTANSPNGVWPTVLNHT